MNKPFTAGLILPFRQNEFSADYNRLKSNVEFRDVPPVFISVGFHFGE